MRHRGSVATSPARLRHSLCWKDERPRSGTRRKGGYSDYRVAAVYQEIGTGHERGLVAGEEYCARRHFRGRAQTPEQGGGMLMGFRFIRPLAEEPLVGSRAGRQGVGANVLCAVIDGEG